MKQRHGISGATKVLASDGGTQSVLVTDASPHVQLAFGASVYAAGMTPEQADFVASALVASAKRVRAQNWAKKGTAK